MSEPPWRVCLFCASSLGNDPRFAAAARDLGRGVARRGWGLVYGGGRVGLMGLAAQAALEEGGEVIGVIPRALAELEVAHPGLSALHVVATMHERKQRMHALSQAFATLPGGLGTLDELFETLTWAQLGEHEKPVGLLEIGNYWAPLLAWMDGAVQAGLLRPQNRALLLVEHGVETLLARLEACSQGAGPRAAPLERWLESKDL